MTAISISIRDLHARTGHFVRKAAELPVVITDNGKPVAEIRPLSRPPAQTQTKSEKSYWANRGLLPGFKVMMDSGALKPKPGKKSVDEILDEIRADSAS